MSIEEAYTIIIDALKTNDRRLDAMLEQSGLTADELIERMAAAAYNANRPTDVIDLLTIRRERKDGPR